MWLRLPPRRRKELIECARFLGKDAMRLFALALTLSLADFAAASATPPPCCAPRRERPRHRRATEQRDELAALER